jgi:hypothetical protein
MSPYTVEFSGGVADGSHMRLNDSETPMFCHIKGEARSEHGLRHVHRYIYSPISKKYEYVLSSLMADEDIPPSQGIIGDVFDPGDEDSSPWDEHSSY